MLTPGRSYFSLPSQPKLFYHYTPLSSSICLIFLHGLGGNTSAWNPIVDHYHRQGISTLTIDLLGHGHSDRPTNPDLYSISSQADLLLPLLKQLPQKHLILVGHCFGAMVALTFAANHSKIIHSLVLIDTSPQLPQTVRSFFQLPFFQSLFSLIYHRLPNLHLPEEVDYSEFVGTTDWDIRRITSDVLHTSLRSYLSACQALLGYDATKLLSKITVPTLVIVGQNDSIFPPSVSASLHKRLKNSFFELIPNANHIIVVNNPHSVNHSLDHFLHHLKLL